MRGRRSQIPKNTSNGKGRAEWGIEGNRAGNALGRGDPSARRPDAGRRTTSLPVRQAERSLIRTHPAAFGGGVGRGGFVEPFVQTSGRSVLGLHAGGVLEAVGGPVEARPRRDL